MDQIRWFNRFIQCINQYSHIKLNIHAYMQLIWRWGILYLHSFPKITMGLWCCNAWVTILLIKFLRITTINSTLIWIHTLVSTVSIHLVFMCLCATQLNKFDTGRHYIWRDAYTCGCMWLVARHHVVAQRLSTLTL